MSGLKSLAASSLAGLLCLSPYLVAEDEAEDEIEDLMQMDLEELMKMKIVSATNWPEQLSDAPATVIVITRDDIRQRGYLSLIDIFSDLPGIDVAITYGDFYYRPYWRGYRKGLGSPFLFMIDGMVLNHLYFNSTDIVAAVPLSMIDRIEVVYGPASAVYGANALMGVVNVITIKTATHDGVSMDSTLSGGSFEAREFDATFLYKKGDFMVRGSGFLSKGDVDKESIENYEWTKSKYLSDRSLWGGFLDNSEIAGRASIPQNHRSYSLAASFGTFEAGVQSFTVESGWGLNYAFDKIQPLSHWVQPDINAYFRNSQPLNRRVTSTTLVRYRTSDVQNDSFGVEGYNTTPAPGQTVRVVGFSYWQTLNRSWSLFQDFDVNLSDELSLKTGVKYEQRNLQKAYDAIYGPEVPPWMMDLATYDFPDPPEDTYRNENRITWTDEAAYVQAKYRISGWFNRKDDHFLNFGLRFDHNSIYGLTTTTRIGYVGNFGKFGAKLLYGESFQEPVPRELYGGWHGYGSSPVLKPEEARIFELSLNRTSRRTSILVNPYIVSVRNSIATLPIGAVNLGKRNIHGLDAHAYITLPVKDRVKIKCWGYYSFIHTEEEKFDANGVKTGTGLIGDIAPHKLYVGTTAVLDDKITATIRGRYVSERTTVDTNPVRKIEDYLVMDFNVEYERFLNRGIGLSLRIANLFDRQYSHPGLRAANAGNTPGYWDDENVWRGSGGFSNSLLPQPGRSIVFPLRVHH